MSPIPFRQIRKLCAALSLGLAASLTLSPAQAEAPTLEPGTLKVGMDITYPPFESYDGDEVVGLDPDLARLLAQKLGTEVEFIDTRFAGLVLGLGARRFDTVMSGMYIVPERLEQAQAIPYGRTGAAILVRAGTENPPTRPEDLCGMSVGLQQGTTWVAQLGELSEQYCEPNGHGPINIQEFASAPEATQAMLSNNIQAQMEIRGAALMIAERTRDRVEVSTTELVYPQTIGIFLRKDDQALHDAIVAALDELKASGDYQALLEQYGIEPPTGS
ncbi:ABC transporter substrate-binding protein [Halotalea alkalilenta]|uniref:ABC transporter substrate-binding protein n=1 Tax=Halotalea alkalilenta TaxID=376489 RepID=UPI0006948DB6|nr:ABC transporter substrate-binding protein [Halotalea alkalilenta]